MSDKQALPLCDLVLQGGVTSALIYTGLIARLSRHYQFKNLGGTSSGALAAAAAAIAQRAKLETLKLNKRGGTTAEPDAAFEAVRDFAAELSKTDQSGRTVLFRLFQPQPSTSRGYRAVAAYRSSSRPSSDREAWGRALWTILIDFPIPALVGALSGLWTATVTWITVPQMDGWAAVASGVMAVSGLVLAVVAGVLTAVAWAVFATVRSMVANDFGLCNGMQGIAEPGDVPLTPMIHRLFNRLLGRGEDAQPVVFGELWGEPGLRPGGRREIDLQVITTVLNLRRPLRLPNDPGSDPLRGFFYARDEWARFFPDPVMRWLDEHPPIGGSDRVTDELGNPLRGLPSPAMWPVVVAVRLSLSFPGLLSAVPMYALEGRRSVRVDKQRSAPVPRSDAGGAVTYVARKVHLSDGGVTSNCPVHLFDAPLPRHPTFGVRLDDYAVGAGRRHRIWLPGDTEPPPIVRPFAGSSARAIASSFVASIVGTATGWRDSLQSTLPGYRERIVVVGLKPDEGGLNLAMAPRTIYRLAALGSRAALRLQQAFGNTRLQGQRNAWDAHCWLRMRSTLAAAQRLVGEIRDGVGPAPSDATDGAPQQAARSGCRELLDLRPPPEPALSDSRAVSHARELLDDLAALAGAPGSAPPADLSENASRPQPRLRMSAPW